MVDAFTIEEAFKILSKQKLEANADSYHTTHWDKQYWHPGQTYMLLKLALHFFMPVIACG
jgi:hypothetical protein